MKDCDEVCRYETLVVKIETGLQIAADGCGRLTEQGSWGWPDPFDQSILQPLAQTERP